MSSKNLARAGLARLLAVAILLVVGGCAGTKVGEVISKPPSPVLAQPRTIAVVVQDESPVPEKVSRREEHQSDVQTAVAALSESLAKRLADRGLAVASNGQPTDLILHCRIVEVRGGSKALRLLVGYGAGKAVLRIGVSLEEGRGATTPPLLSFESDGTSGHMPGGGFSAGGLVGAGVGALRKDGLPKEVEQAMERIDEELGKYFSAQNWRYEPLAKEGNEKPSEGGE